MTPASKFARLVAYSYELPTYDFGAKDRAARAHIETVDGLKTVAIPGTDNFACWLADLQAIVKHTALGLVHHGFDDAAQTILGQVIGEEPAVLAGHSEGADLALLFAGYMCLAGHVPKIVWAFDPAHLCADDALVNIFSHYNVDIRITHHGLDVVPIVPRILAPWRHPAPVVQFGKPLWPIHNIEDHYLKERFFDDLDAAQL